MESKSCSRCGAPMSSINTDEFYCEFCGEKIKEKKVVTKDIQQQVPPVIQTERVYIREQVKQEDDYREYDPLGVGMWIFCLLVPIVGLISFFTYRSNDYTKKSNQALLAGVIGFVLTWMFLLLEQNN